MNSIVAGVLIFAAAVNAAVMPEYHSSVVTSERDGNNFAYTVHDQQAVLQNSQAMMLGKPLAYARALPGQLSLITPRQYIVPGAAGLVPGAAGLAPGAAGLAPIPGISHIYGGAYPAARYGAYAAQPLTYPGQPLLMGHQPLLGDIARQQIIVPQVKA